MGVSNRIHDQSSVGKKVLVAQIKFCMLDFDKITNKSCVTEYSINIECSTNEL